MIGAMARHRVQVLRAGGKSLRRIATETGIPLRSVKRIVRESPIEALGDVESAKARGVGRPSVVEEYHERIVDVLAAEPKLKTIEILHRLRGLGYDGAKTALYDTPRILAFAVGKPSDAFGEPYRVFDAERVIARLPGPPYQFLDRIVRVTGCEPWVMKAGGTATAEYDVPPDAWYFAAERAPVMPFAVLLEVALQPCGWLAAYVGSALASDTDLSFRNLGGKATLFDPVGPDAGTLVTTAKMTRVSQSGGMIIQHYDMAVRTADGRPVYEGDTYFGFFTKAALAQQVGLREVTVYEPTADEIARGERFAYPIEPPFPDVQLRMVDHIDLFVPEGGPHGQGFIRGTKEVDPDEWFFQAHFYQDPVCPGSLGLESFVQLLKVVAARRWGAAPGTLWEATAPGHKHEWVYRGQVVPTNRRVTVQAEVHKIDPLARVVTADGLLLVDGRAIYQMKDFSLRQRP